MRIVRHAHAGKPATLIIRGAPGITYGCAVHAGRTIFIKIDCLTFLALSFLINENILGKCFRSSSSSKNPRISPLTMEYEYPQLSLLIITSVRKPTK